ncbi:hypothetical protein NKH47_08140 [Mesorhizobium sp. M1060]|uniref:hypothetical protein n=1 Tax=Mesorhizobium sp. M1060 TaxID=2957052 RepID=UPI0033397B9F
MLRLLRATLVFVLFCALSLSVLPAGAVQITVHGTHAFTPKVGFNPTCTMKQVPPPFQELAFHQYQSKTFGYVRYCAVMKGDMVKVSIINEWTNGRSRASQYLCTSSTWLDGNGKTVFDATYGGNGINVGGGGDITRSKSKVLTMDQFKSIRTWSWSFGFCPPPIPITKPPKPNLPASHYGEDMYVCAGKYLDGWAVVDVSTSNDCGNALNNKWHLKNLNGAPSGAFQTICRFSHYPDGWVITGYLTDYTRCGDPTNDNLRMIQKG